MYMCDNSDEVVDDEEVFIYLTFRLRAQDFFHRAWRSTANNLIVLG